MAQKVSTSWHFLGENIEFNALTLSDWGVFETFWSAWTQVAIIFLVGCYVFVAALGKIAQRGEYFMISA
jgi:hypothetical protein